MGETLVFPKASDATWPLYEGPETIDPALFASASSVNPNELYNRQPLVSEVLDLQARGLTGLNVCRVRNTTGSQIDAGTLCYVGTVTTAEVTGDSASQLSSISLYGVTYQNSSSGRLYWTLTNEGTTRTINLYSAKSHDTDKNGTFNASNLVASGSRSGDGAVTITQENSSGITGSITVAYTADDEDASNTIEAYIYTVLVADAAAQSTVAKFVAIEDIANNAVGTIATSFVLTGVDTSTCSLANPIYLGSSGAFSASAGTVTQKVGRCLVVNATTGVVVFALDGNLYPLADSFVGDVAISQLDIDGGTDIGADLVDADLIVVDDGASGTNRKSAVSRIWTYITGKLNAVTTLTLSLLNLDIDGGTDIGADLADADLIIVDDGASGTNRKSAISRIWTYITGKLNAATTLTLSILNLNIDGGTDIGADLADADLIIVDDGAGGTNRKSAVSRIWTYITGKLNAATTLTLSILNIDIDGGTDIGADLADADLIVVDDGAGGTNRKSAVSRLWTYIWGKIAAVDAKTTPVDADKIVISDSEASNAAKLLAMSNLATYTTGKLWQVEAHASGDTLTTAERGTIHTNEGCSAEITLALPAPFSGAGPFTFFCQDANGVKVQAPTGVTVTVPAGSTASAGYIRSSSVGSYLRIIGINSTQYFAESVGGTWTIDS